MVNRFAQGAIALHQELSGLLEGVVFSVYLNAHSPGDGTVLLRQHIEFGTEGDIGFAKQTEFILHLAKEDSVLRIFAKGGQGGRGHEFTVESIVNGFHGRLDIQTKVVEGFFNFFIFGVAGHADLPPAGIFAHNGLEFAPIGEPLAEGVGGIDIAFFQLRKIGCYGIPMG